MKRQPSTKRHTITGILRKRLKEAHRELKIQERSLEKLRKPPPLVRNDEMIASVNYTVGYLTAVCVETELFLSLVKMTDLEITDYIALHEKIEKENFEHLQKLIANATKDRKILRS